LLSRIEMGTFPRDYLEPFLEVNDRNTLIKAKKFHVLLTWLVGQSTVCGEDLKLFRYIDLFNIGAHLTPLTLRTMELVFRLNRPEITAMVSRELLHASLQPKYSQDWTQFQPKDIGFRPLEHTRPGLARIKFWHPDQSLNLPPLPPLRLTSISKSPTDSSWTLRLEFPEIMTYQYDVCYHKLMELQDHCVHHLESLQLPELAPFRPDIAKGFIGIISHSQGHPYILARTQLPNLNLEGCTNKVSIDAITVPSWIRVTLHSHLAIGTKLSIVREIGRAEVRLIS
jgi:hypothetical protein